MTEQLFQIGIKGLIRNDSGKILMLFIPEWGKNPEHWDLPGGRIDPGETFLDTLKRELEEEIGVTYVGDPRQLASFLTNITIPVNGVEVPLVFVVYEVALPDGSEIKLDPNSVEKEYRWLSPTEAADKMTIKFSSDFCDMVRKL